jgi:glutaredoxin
VAREEVNESCIRGRWHSTFAGGLGDAGASDASSRAGGYDVEVIDATNDGAGALLMQLAETLHHEIVLPYVFVDDRPVGGFGDIKDLDCSGALEILVRGKV